MHIWIKRLDWKRKEGWVWVTQLSCAYLISVLQLTVSHKNSIVLAVVRKHPLFHIQQKWNWIWHITYFLVNWVYHNTTQVPRISNDKFLITHLNIYQLTWSRNYIIMRLLILLHLVEWIIQDWREGSMPANISWYKPPETVPKEAISSSSLFHNKMGKYLVLNLYLTTKWKIFNWFLWLATDCKIRQHKKYVYTMFRIKFQKVFLARAAYQEMVQILWKLLTVF